jgi:hypothetical protein
LGGWVSDEYMPEVMKIALMLMTMFKTITDAENEDKYDAYKIGPD